MLLELLVAFSAGAVSSSYLHFKKRRKSSSGPAGQAVALRTPPVSSAEVLADPRMRLGVLFMSLPPELSTRLFNEIGPDQVEKITLAISSLPPITPELRSQVLGEFAASLGIAVHRLEDAAREEPGLVARGMVTHFNL